MTHTIERSAVNPEQPIARLAECALPINSKGPKAHSPRHRSTMIDRRRRSYRDIEHRMLANPDQARAGGIAADVGRNS
jgi:hypothetical protein